MPVYTYRCTACGAEREVQRKIENRDKPVLCLISSCARKRAGFSAGHDELARVRFAAPMVRVPTSGSFKIEGYNAANGYSNSKR